MLIKNNRTTKRSYYTLSVASALALSLQANPAFALNLRLDKDAAYLSVKANRSEQKLAKLAKTARQTGDYPQALDYYQALASRNPSFVDYKIAHALVQIDSKNYASAEDEINTIKDQHVNNVDLLNAQIYLGQQTNSAIKILDAGQRLLAINPNDKAVLGTLALAASNLGATAKALALSEKQPLDSERTQQLQANHAALHIRRGEFDSADPLKPYAETDKALRLLDKACGCAWDQLDVSNPTNQRLVFDRMQALLNRHRAKEVLQHFNQLQAKNIKLPAHALQSVGGAYLQQRQPEKALAMFNEVLTQSPDSYETKLDKFYALIELERFDEATQLITQTSANEASYHNRNNNPTIRENDKKLQLDLTRALALSYGDDLAGSEALLSTLQQIGPSNIEVKTALADTWRQRGWVDLARDTFETSLVQDKHNTQIKYGLANTYLDGRDWALAEKEIKALNAYLSPEEPSLKALNKRWKLHQKRQFTTNFSTTETSGAIIAAKSRNLDAAVYSAPINDNYRAFVSGGYSNDDFPEGTGSIFRPSAGLEYRNHDWLASAQLGLATKDGSNASAAVNAEYRANDHWLFNTNLELNSPQSPTRGQRVGINGDSASIGATYRWSESTQADVSASYMRMDDGNKRKSMAVSLDRRLITKPHYKANVGINASTSANTLENAAYFNPENDKQVGITLTQDWLTWRRYDRSFTQQLGLGYGHYQQENFGGDTTWDIRYSHEWNIDNLFNLTYGIARRRQAYDGVSEFNDSLFGGINLLF